jgi:hypothetical protein
MVKEKDPTCRSGCGGRQDGRLCGEVGGGQRDGFLR